MNKEHFICQCQDSAGTPHNQPMTQQEYKQDGMCESCADNVWIEINTQASYIWVHRKELTCI